MAIEQDKALLNNRLSIEQLKEKYNPEPSKKTQDSLGRWVNRRVVTEAQISANLQKQMSALHKIEDNIDGYIKLYQRSKSIVDKNFYTERIDELKVQYGQFKVEA